MHPRKAAEMGRLPGRPGGHSPLPHGGRGGIVIGSVLVGLVASAWGVIAPSWLAFAGSALILAVIWRSLLQIAHADEHARASAPTAGA